MNILALVVLTNLVVSPKKADSLLSYTMPKDLFLSIDGF